MDAVDAGPTCGAQYHPRRPSQQLSGGKGYPPKPQSSGFLLSPKSWPKGKGRGSGHVLFPDLNGGCKGVVSQ